MVALPPRELPVPVRSSLPLWAPIVLACSIAVGIGVVEGLAGGRAVLAAVGLVGLVVSAVGLLRPPTLVLDAEGLALRTPLGVRWRRAWHECGEFRTWRDFVVWDGEIEAAHSPRKAASWRKRADADAGIAAQFGGLDAADLAALLNRYRGGATMR